MLRFNVNFFSCVCLRRIPVCSCLFLWLPTPAFLLLPACLGVLQVSSYVPLWLCLTVFYAPYFLSIDPSSCFLRRLPSSKNRRSISWSLSRSSQVRMGWVWIVLLNWIVCLSAPDYHSLPTNLWLPIFANPLASRSLFNCLVVLGLEWKTICGIKSSKISVALHGDCAGWNKTFEMRK